MYDQPSYSEMMSIERRMAQAQSRQAELPPETLRQRNMALEWFLHRLIKAMPTMSKNDVIKLLGRKALETLELGNKDTSKNENAKINYRTDAVFEHATGIKAYELF